MTLQSRWNLITNQFTLLQVFLSIHWKDWCWSSNTLATWCKEPTHWKRPWCWERLRAGREGVNRGWDDWMASSTQWTCVWANSGRWWRTGKPGMLQSVGSQRVGHDWTRASGLQSFKGLPSDRFPNSKHYCLPLLLSYSSAWLKIRLHENYIGFLDVPWTLSFLTFTCDFVSLWNIYLSFSIS